MNLLSIFIFHFLTSSPTLIFLSFITHCLCLLLSIFIHYFLTSSPTLIIFSFITHLPHLHHSSSSSFPKQDVNQSYWNDLTTIVQDELRRLRQRDVTSLDLSAHHRQGIHAAVASDVSNVFMNKSVAELNQLQRNIESKLAGPTTGLDIGYWESLLSQLRGKGGVVVWWWCGVVWGWWWCWWWCWW